MAPVRILCVIPARFASTRFPGKPLVNLGGKTMIRRVVEQAEKCPGFTKVVVATDHTVIAEHVEQFGGKVCMTSPDHVSGTDRCYEVVTKQEEEFDYIVNIQGDEPFIAPAQIELLIEMLNGTTQLATLKKKITSREELFNPNTVKVISDHNNEAVYFSRATIPHLRNVPEDKWFDEFTFYKHIGLYAYRNDVLAKITSLPVSALEKAESLEQLRWLENGFRIAIAETTHETIGIDTPEDLARALSYLQNQR